MKVSTIGAPAPQAPSTAAQDARARAIAKLTSNAAPIPVDQNNISPEEISAIKPPVAAKVEESQGQNDISEDTVPPEDKKETVSNQYVLLARKEKALRAKAQQQDAAFKAREQALAEREAALTSQKPDLSQYISKVDLKANTLRILNEEGISYDELTQQQIDQGSISPAIQSHLDRLEARLRAQDEALEKARKGQEDQQTEAYKAAIGQITKDVNQLVFTDPEFEMIKATKSTKDVVELIEATYREEGRLMDIEEAAREVEQHLFEEVEKLTRLEKIKKRIEAKPAAQQTSNEQTPQTKQPQTMKTLTNATSSQRQLSAKERAILAFKGELKS